MFLHFWGFIKIVIRKHFKCQFLDTTVFSSMELVCDLNRVYSKSYLINSCWTVHLYFKRSLIGWQPIFMTFDCSLCPGKVLKEWIFNFLKWLTVQKFWHLSWELLIGYPQFRLVWISNFILLISFLIHSFSLFWISPPKSDQWEFSY